MRHETLHSILLGGWITSYYLDKISVLHLGEFSKFLCNKSFITGRIYVPIAAEVT
jgi:hypothetical protein